MAGQIKAEIGAIDEIRKSIEVYFAHIEKIQQTLLTHAEALAKAWEGEAHAEFHDGFQKECMKLESLRGEGLALCGFEKKAVDIYGSTEMEIGEKIRAI